MSPLPKFEDLTPEQFEGLRKLVEEANSPFYVLRDENGEELDADWFVNDQAAYARAKEFEDEPVIDVLKWIGFVDDQKDNKKVHVFKEGETVIPLKEGEEVLCLCSEEGCRQRFEVHNGELIITVNKNPTIVITLPGDIVIGHRSE